MTLLFVSMFAVACATPGRPSIEPPTARPSAPTFPPEVSGTSTRTAQPVPTPVPTPAHTPAPPPLAEIVTADGSIRGTLGTYSIDGRGSDAPWLPFASLPGVGVADGELLTIRFVDGVGIGQWQVLLAPASDTGGLATRGVEGGMLGPLADVLTVGPLPAGSWVLQARLFRADERGDGLTYWAVTVP